MMFFKKEKKGSEPVEEEFQLNIPQEQAAPFTQAAYPAAYNKPVFLGQHEKMREDYAPLFVKIEKYRDLLATIAEMKMFVSSMRQIFSATNDIEALRNDAHKIMRATVQRMEKAIIEVDSELLRPKGFEVEFPSSELDVHQIEDSLTDIQKQMSLLKREIEGMR